MAKKCRVYKKMPTAQAGYNFTGVTNPAEYRGQLIEAGQNVDNKAYFEAWNASPQGANNPYTADLDASPDSAIYKPIPKIPVPSVNRGPAITNMRGSSGPIQYGKGARFTKKPVFQIGGESNDQISMTQDSQQDPVPQEKTADFLSWLRKTTQEKRLDEELEGQEALYNEMVRGGYVNPQNAIQDYQIGGEPKYSGAQSGDYFQKEDVNAKFFMESLENKTPDTMNNLAMFTRGATQFANSRPRGAYEPINGETYEQPDSKSPFKMPDAMPDTGFGSKQPDMFGRNTDKSFGRGQSILKAQDGISYPGQLPLIPEIDDSLMLLPEIDEVPIAQGLTPNVISEDDYTTAPVTEFVPGGPDDPMMEGERGSANDRGSFGSIGMDPRNTNIAQGAIAGMRLAEGLFSMGDRMREEEKLKARFSNVFETHGTAGTDRGDYMVNVPGVGDPLKPNQHTRMGYNTKIAQNGGAYEIDDELELTEEQINNLVAQGYNLEYLD